jgi:hypothetical protein
VKWNVSNCLPCITNVDVMWVCEVGACGSLPSCNTHSAVVLMLPVGGSANSVVSLSSTVANQR